MNHKVTRKLNFPKKYFLFLSCILLIYSFVNYIGSLTVSAKKYDVSELVFENSHFINIDGVLLHYRIWQPIESNSHGNILLIHGLGGSTFSWRYVVPSLVEQGYPVVAVDLPGFGLSQRKPAIRQSHENRANLIWVFIENIGLEGSWHLVGHSMGGGVVASMGLQKRSDTKTVVLVAGLIDHGNSRILSLIFRSRFFRNFAARFMDRFFLTKRRIKSFLTSAYGREPTPEELEGYYQPLQLEYTYLTLSNLLRKYSSDSDLLDKLDEIRVPVLYLWGSEDEWVSASKGEKIIQKIPDAELLLIHEAKHCPMETHPEIFNRYLLDFLEKK